MRTWSGRKRCSRDSSNSKPPWAPSSSRLPCSNGSWRKRSDCRTCRRVDACGHGRGENGERKEIRERGKQDQIECADIGAHLAHHGLNVVIKRMPLGDVDVAAVLLSHAADEDVDFIVMGGYGHSRLREFVLGGVTRSMLRTMTVPALMSH